MGSFVMEVEHERDYVVAFDKTSARSIDVQGFMHVDGCNISKATVNPYLGSEIPNWRALGLEPSRVYRVFRPPEELAKAAKTFNNLPLLAGHKVVTAEELDDPSLKDFVVGSTGTDATFDYPYLRNSLVVWTREAIDGISKRERHELSCAYRYVYVPGAGTHEGMQYDGRMTNIVGNHVALVEVGRAGHDVMVADAAINLPATTASQEPRMGKQKSRKIAPQGHVVRGALLAYLHPRLAADASIEPGELSSIVKSVEPGRYHRQIDGLVGAVAQAFKGRLAEDTDVKELSTLLLKLEDAFSEDEQLTDDAPMKCPKCGATVQDADMIEDGSMCHDCAKKETKKDTKTPVNETLVDEFSKKYNLPKDALGTLLDALSTAQKSTVGDAMNNPLLTDAQKAEIAKITADAALTPEQKAEAIGRITAEAQAAADSAAAVEAARVAAEAANAKKEAPAGITQDALNTALADQRKAIEGGISAKFQAAKEVAQHIGDVDAMAADSAESIYKLALDAKKVPLEGVHPSAYRSLVKMLPAATEAAPTVIAADAQSITEFTTRYPHAKNLKKG